MNLFTRQRRLAVCLAAAVVSSLGAFAVPAQALNTSNNAGTSLDGTGDVVDLFDGSPYTGPGAARADITGASVEYLPGEIAFSLNVNQPTSPSADPNWLDGASAALWAIDVDGDATTAEYYATLSADAGGNLVGSVGDDAGELCAAQVAASLTAPHYSLRFDASCIGSPGAIHWGGIMLYDTDPSDPAAVVALDAVPNSDFMDGPVFSPTATNDPPISTAGDQGLWLVARDGGIFALNAGFSGSTGGVRLNQPIVGMAADPDRRGYWFVAADGGIFSFDAPFFGSTGAVKLNQPIVGMAATPTGQGYWMVASDGGIFAFGDAGFFGSTGAVKLNQPIVGMAATPTGNGYWLVASDGGIFAFGDAGFFGSTGAVKLNQPIVAMAPTPTGNGYWFVARDGGVFAFGDAVFRGSAVGPTAPVVGMAPSKLGDGYWIVRADGRVSNFGSAPNIGSLSGTRLNQPIVGAAASR